MPKHKYGIVQVHLPSKLAKDIHSWGVKSIPDQAVYRKDEKYGRETDIHMTVLYGLVDAKPDQVREVLAEIKPFRIRLGKISLFRNDEFDVVKIGVTSPGAVKINRLLRDNLRYETDYPTYKPHVTVAYARKENAPEVEGDESFDGDEFEVHELQYRSAEGSRSAIHLG